MEKPPIKGGEMKEERYVTITMIRLEIFENWGSKSKKGGKLC
jgi:hypothetical protein